MSFNHDVFSNILKITNFIPIHKNGDKLDCNNYRPVSLLSNSKVNEESIHICLRNFLMKKSSYCVINLASEMDALLTILPLVYQN